MKKLLFLLIVIASYFFTPIIFAQSFSIEAGNLAKKNNEWFLSNTPNLVKKSPINPKDISPAQLTDESLPNAVEINEINKAMDQRLRFTSEYRQIALKYIKPLEAGQALANNSKNATAQQNSYALRLRDGKINFGQYNQEKQRLYAETVAKSKEIVEKYDLKSQFNAGQSPQQAPPQPSTPTSQGMTVNDLVNFKNKGAAIGSCFGLMQGTMGRRDLAYDGMSIMDFHTKFMSLDNIVPMDQKLESNALFNETINKSSGAPALVVNKAIQMCLRLIN